MVDNLTKRERDMRDGLPVLVRLILVAYASVAAHWWSGVGPSIGLVVVLTAWPLTIIAPMRWRGELAPERYETLSVGFLSGLALVIVAAFADSRGDDFPAVAVVLAVGAVLLWAVAITMGVMPHSATVTVWICAAVWGLAGVVSELPDPPGIASLAYVAYGATGAAIGVALYRSPDE